MFSAEFDELGLESRRLTFNDSREIPPKKSKKLWKKIFVPIPLRFRVSCKELTLKYDLSVYVL